MRCGFFAVFYGLFWVNGSCGVRALVGGGKLKEGECGVGCERVVIGGWRRKRRCW